MVGGARILYAPPTKMFKLFGNFSYLNTKDGYPLSIINIAFRNAIFDL